MLGPDSVIATVCSTCADRFASAVTTVRLSLSVRVFAVPTFTFGSIATVTVHSVTVLTLQRL